MSINDRTRLLLFVRSGGRCAVCYDDVTTSRLTWRAIPLGQQAHIVGRSTGKRSPRGEHPLPEPDRDEVDNLVLLCGRCHPDADHSENLDVVTVGVTPPSGWEVAFDNQEVSIPAGETVPVTATITPSEEAVAGDYVISFTATHEQADAEMEIRTTVNPSAVWGIVGIVVIALTLAGLAWVFRRFGRR